MINLYDPKNNANKHDIYYEYNTKRYPDLNQKHLYQLLVHHYDLLADKTKNNQNKKKIIKNLKRNSKCPHCFVPNNVVCEHTTKRKRKYKGTEVQFSIIININIILNNLRILRFDNI